MFGGNWQAQQKAQKDAERRRKKEAAESLANFKGTVSKEQEVFLENRKLKKQDQEKKKAAAAELNTFKGTVTNQELEFQQKLKQKKDQDRKSKKSAEENLNSYQGPGSPVPPPDGGKAKGVTKSIEEGLADISIYKEEEDGENNNKKKKKEKKKPNKVKEWNPTAQQTNKKTTTTPIEVGKSRKTVTLEFSFGLVTDEETIPDMEMLNSASSMIVPEILEGSLKECNLRCDCKVPIPNGDIEEDAWFESDDSVRWKVTGTVPVKIPVNSTADEGKTIDEIAAPIQKMLKRYSSYRQQSDGTWKRVREGRLALGITF